MFILFFLFWLVLNGRFTMEIAIFGIVLAAALYAFICCFMNYRPWMDLFLLKKIPLIIEFLFLLIAEIVKANLVMARYIFSPDILAEPALVKFEAGLHTRFARTLLADAITMTPGTITVEVSDDVFCVHCYDKSMGEDLEDSSFVRLLRRIESGY